MSQGRAVGTGSSSGYISPATMEAIRNRTNLALDASKRKTGITRTNDQRPGRNLSIGWPALNVPGVSGPDVAGKYLGMGTYGNVNTAPFAFNTKTPQIISALVADRLNELLVETITSIENIDPQTANLANYTTGLGNGYVNGFYQQDITKYFPDNKARLWFSTVEGVPSILLPGSTEQIAAAQQGYSVGQVTIKNPLNSIKKGGYTKVGSKGWRDAIAKWYNNQMAAPVDINALQHFVGQGAVYGLGPVFAELRIEVGVEQGDDGFFKFHIKNEKLEDLAQDRNFMTRVQDYYDAYLKSPDQQRLGNFGAASLAARHQGVATMGSNGEVGQTFIDQLQGGLAKGSMKNLWKYKAGHTSFNQRRGLTAFPLRDREGNPLEQPFRADGFCNIAGSGLGMTQKSTDGGQYGYRFSKNKRNYISKAAGKQGSQLSDPTYNCGSGTKDYYLDQNRSLYAANQERTLPGVSLQQAVIAGQKAIVAAGGPYNAYKDLDSEDLAARYRYALEHPEIYGGNPAYRTVRSDGTPVSFARYGPRQYEANLTAEQQKAFEIENLNQNWKVEQSNNLLGQFKTNPNAVAQSRGQKILTQNAASWRVPGQTK